MTIVNSDVSYTGLVEKYIGTAYDNVKIVADNITAVIAVANLSADDWLLLTTIEGMEVEILAVAGIESQVRALAPLTAQIQLLGVQAVLDDMAVLGADPQIIADIAIVATNIDIVRAVVQNKANIDICAANILAIQDAPTHAETSSDSALDSESWAIEPEGSVVQEHTASVGADVVPPGYSSLHHAAKSKASEIAALASETDAFNSRNLAIQASNNASASEIAAAASFAAMNELYLGEFDSDPTTTVDGAMYWNTPNGKMYVWNTTAWEAIINATLDYFGIHDPSGASEYPNPLPFSDGFYLFGNALPYLMTGGALSGITVNSGDYLVYDLDNTLWEHIQGASGINNLIRQDGTVAMIAPLRLQTAGGITEMKLDYKGIIFSNLAILFSIASSTATGEAGLHVTSNNNVGVGVTAPIAQLQVGTHVYLSDGHEIDGTGDRMVWEADTGAFRAGRAVGTSWDAGNIGSSSVAFGVGNTASGHFSFAHGADSESKGEQSFAMGYEANTLLDFGFAYGEWVTAPGYNETIFGRYNSEYSPIGQWEPLDRLFSLGNGNGTDPGDRSNALTVLNNGNVGIGNEASALAPASRLVVPGLPSGTTRPGGLGSGALWLDTTDGGNDPILRVVP